MFWIHFLLAYYRFAQCEARQDNSCRLASGDDCDTSYESWNNRNSTCGRSSTRDAPYQQTKLSYRQPSDELFEGILDTIPQSKPLRVGRDYRSVSHISVEVNANLIINGIS